ncbi:MAG: 30S ribosomal protein S19 [Candidatus Ratteibacteria bacterium]|nr:30S ribosomal protein S19 [Candidatus Ratteibacteria bacterium]
MRSRKKGPYVDQNLMKKVAKNRETGRKDIIKTWSRSSVIIPEFVGYTFAVHNGRTFINLYITENMVGHRFGEFAPTRIFRGHGAHTEKTREKT